MNRLLNRTTLAAKKWQQPIVDGFVQSGSFDVWKNEVLPGICDNSGFAFAFSATLAAPLLHFLNTKGIFLLLKTTDTYEPYVVSEIIRSAWCNPDTPRFLCDSDYFFLRQLFEFAMDLPVALEVHPFIRQRDYSLLVSCFESDGLTLDSDKKGKLCCYSPPCTVAIVTDESSRLTCQQLAGPIPQLIMLTDDDFRGYWGNFNHFNRLYRTCKNHYGTFGPHYTSLILQLHEADLLRSMFESQLNALRLRGSDTKKDSSRFAVMLTGCLILGKLLGDEYSKPLIDSVYNQWQKNTESPG